MTKKANPGRQPATVHAWSSLRNVMSVPAIEGLAREVIKRLNHRGADDWHVPPEELQVLCRYLCAPYPFAAEKMIDRLVASGVPVERIYHTYLAEAARELGDRWNKSELTFEEVGIATTRIYLLLDRLRRQSAVPVESQNPRIAFAAVPGEQHLLGVKMAVDAFRRAGWNVTHLIDHDHDQIVDAASDLDILLIGLSASGRRTRTALLKLVVALRVARPDLKILLSGGIANTEPDFLSEIGIDEIVKDIPSAQEAVERLLRDVMDDVG